MAIAEGMHRDGQNYKMQLMEKYPLTEVQTNSGNGSAIYVDMTFVATARNGTPFCEFVSPVMETHSVR